MAGRIIRESSIRSWAWTEGTEQSATREPAISADGGQRTAGPASQPDPSRPANQPSKHRPPPHGCRTHLPLGAGSALGKIPPLKRFLLKSKPENALSALCIAMWSSVYTNGGLCIAHFTQRSPTTPVSSFFAYPLPLFYFFRGFRYFSLLMFLGELDVFPV
jgi:hypothetical protein